MEPKRTYPKLQGAAGSKGVDYQIKLLQFFLLQGFQNNENFKLSTENRNASGFDDVIYETENSILLQAKHKSKKEEKVISFEHLFPKTQKGDFSVFRYLREFSKIIENFDSNNICNIIVCTNAQFNLENINYSLNNVIKTNKKLYLQEKNIIPPISSIKNTKCYSFDQNQNFLVKYSENLTMISEDVIKLFLDKLLLVSVFDQDLDDQITYLIKQFDIIDENIPLQLINISIFSKIKTWFQSDKGTYLTKQNFMEFISQIRCLKYITGKIKSLSLLLEETAKTYKISKDDYSNSLKNNLVLFKIENKETYDLHEFKIYQLLLNKLILENKKKDQEKLLEKILFVDHSAPVNVIKSIIATFEVPEYVYLILPIFDIFEYIISDINNIIGIQKNKTYKKIIIVTDNLYVENENKFFSNFAIHKTNNIKLNDFSVCIQNKILQKEITFQGYKKPLKNLNDNVKWNDIIDEITLLKLSSGKEIVVNKNFDNYEKIPFYVNRFFIEIEKQKFFEYFKDSYLEYSNSDNPDLEYSDLKYLDSECSDQTLVNRELSEKGFCLKITEKSNNKLIVIFDSPGMGKSTILNRLCDLLRATQYWIIQINLNKHTGIFYNILNKNQTIDTLDQLLDFVKYPEKTKFEANLFNVPKSVVLLVDALDEICPKYSDLILNSLKSIARETNIQKIVIASRPHVLNNLNNGNIDCNIFALKQFSEEESIVYLSKFWWNNLDQQKHENIYYKIEDFTEQLINNLKNDVGCGKIVTLMGIPLQTKMIAVVFSNHCKHFLEDSKNYLTLPNAFTIKWLYEEFIKQKKEIYLHEKCNAAGNEDVIDGLENVFNDAINDYKREAIKLEFPQEVHSCFEIVSSPRRSDEKILKMGILIKFNDDVYFAHRTLSEYFATLHICELIRENKITQEFLEFLVGSYFLRINMFIHHMLVDNIESMSDEFAKNFANLIFTKKCFYLTQLIFLFLKKLGYEKLIGWIENLHIIVGYKHTEEFSKVLNVLTTVYVTNVSGVTPLHLACKYNSNQVVELLIAKGHPLDVLDENSDTPLHYAVKQHKTDIVEFLLDSGCTDNIRNKKGKTALYSAIQEKQLDTVDILADKGNPDAIRDNLGRTPLHDAAMNVCIDSENSELYISNTNIYTCMDIWVNRGHPVNIKDTFGISPLHYAAQSGQKNTIGFLLKKGHPIDVLDNEGKTPLHYAAQSKHEYSVELLLKNGHPIDIKDNFGRLPLHYAVQSGQRNTIKLLLKRGHRVHLQDNEGRTPLHYAAQSKQYIAELLLKNGHPVDIKDNFGKSPLDYAAESGQKDTIKLLLKKGHPVHLQNNAGRTYRYMACTSGKSGTFTTVLL